MKYETTVSFFICLLSSSTVLSQECDGNVGTLLDCDYNQTLYGSSNYGNSDLFGSVSEASQLLPELTKVIQAGCSSQTVRFGCSALYPSCSSGGLGPCRSLCLRVTEDCSAEFIERLQVQLVVLKDILRCDKYPEDSCIGVLELPEPSPSNPVPSGSNSHSASPVPTSTPIDRNTSFVNTTLSGCPPSSINFFTDGAKRFAVGWIATWSVLSFLSTLLTILTFLLKPSRFQYPWRPIVYLAFCFNVHSIGYLFALILGRTIITCPGNEYVTNSISWDWDHVPCLLVFSLLYYSMMAAFLWWLVLTFTWCLASTLKWSNEAIGNLAPFFHCVSWVLPLLMVISLMAGRVVSADELTGICFIVRDESKESLYALLVGVIIPLMIFLIIGITFLTIGLVSVCRIHSFLRHKGQERESIVLEKLIIRVGVFVSIYIFPAAVMIGCFFYELVQRPGWDTIDGCDGDCNLANPTIIIVRVFMFLVIGVLTGVWIWSKKTLTSWKDILANINSCCTGQTSSQIESAAKIDPMELGGSSVANTKYSLN